MMARAVNDLVTEPIRNGVSGVTCRPDLSACPKPCTCTMRSPCTMPSAKPGMRCASISERTYRSMAARSGPSSAAADVDPSTTDAMPQATATRKRMARGREGFMAVRLLCWTMSDRLQVESKRKPWWWWGRRGVPAVEIPTQR